MSENAISAAKNLIGRRSFLKTGALVATPLVAAAPVAAFAADDSRARLARIEDERAVEALQRKFLRYLGGAEDCGEFVASADAVDLGEGLHAIAEDLSHEAIVELAGDGRSAIARCACRVEREIAFTGDSTLEQMARFEGHGSHRHEERRVLATDFVKAADGWKISRARFA